MSAATLDEFLSGTNAAGEASDDVSALILESAAACRTIGQHLSDEALCAPPAIDDGLRHCQRGRHLALLLPVDRPSSLAVNAAVGTIFSIWKTRATGTGSEIGDLVEPGALPLCAGYAIHGPALVLVVALASGVHAFAHDRQRDKFRQVRADLRIPDTHSSDRAVRRDVDGSPASEVHRLLTIGGGFVYPCGRPLQLLAEVAPLCHVVERAGGRASIGTMPIVEAGLKGDGLEEALILGTVDEVQRLESHRRAPEAKAHDAPLFGTRGLFRPSA